MKIKRSISGKFSSPRSLKIKNDENYFKISCYLEKHFLELCIIEDNDIFDKQYNIDQIKDFLFKNKEKIILDKTIVVFYDNYKSNCIQIIDFLKENDLCELMEFCYYADEQSFYGKIL